MSERARVIELIPDQIETNEAIVPTPVRHGYVISDTERDILRLFVIERHKASGRTGRGLVKGFGLKQEHWRRL
jgi:adenine deaminase